MDLTIILERAEAGDSSARAELIQAAYDELRSLAADFDSLLAFLSGLLFACIY